MQPHDLLETAKALHQAVRSRGRPKQAYLHRAVSTAYYAVFHALCRMCADSLIGSTHAARRQPAWLQTYRALEHGYCKNQCKNGLIKDAFPQEVRHFCEAFLLLQEKRHLADYDPTMHFALSEVQEDIALAERAIRNLQSLRPEDKKAFAIWVLLKQRP